MLVRRGNYIKCHWIDICPQAWLQLPDRKSRVMDLYGAIGGRACKKDWYGINFDLQDIEMLKAKIDDIKFNAR